MGCGGGQGFDLGRFSPTAIPFQFHAVEVDALLALSRVD